MPNESDDEWRQRWLETWQTYIDELLMDLKLLKPGRVLSSVLLNTLARRYMTPAEVRKWDWLFRYTDE